MSKKTIVVVGAGQGLGNHVAERFAKEDFRVVLVARRSEALAEYQKDFEAKGYETSAIACDVTDAESVKNAFGKIHEEVGTPMCWCIMWASPHPMHNPWMRVKCCATSRLTF